MSTLSVPPSPRKRRYYAPALKARLVAACQQPGASVSRLARDNGLKANLVRRWVREARQSGATPSPIFVPLSLPVATVEHRTEDKHRTIRIEISRARGAVVIEWPSEQAQHCVALLRELLP